MHPEARFGFCLLSQLKETWATWKDGRVTSSQSEEFLRNNGKAVTESQESPGTKARTVWPIDAMDSHNLSSGCQKPQHFPVVLFPSGLGTL